MFPPAAFVAYLVALHSTLLQLGYSQCTVLIYSQSINFPLFLCNETVVSLNSNPNNNKGSKQ